MLSLRHSFQAFTPFLITFTCSGFAIFDPFLLTCSSGLEPRAAQEYTTRGAAGRRLGSARSGSADAGTGKTRRTGGVQQDR